MTLLVDDTFAVSPAAGFASMAAASGTPTQTYNAGAQAVDIAHGNANTAWIVDSIPAHAQLAIEVDVEIVAQTFAGLAMGFFLRKATGPGNFGLTLHHNLSEPNPTHWYSYATAVGMAASFTLVTTQPVLGSPLYRPYIQALSERRTLRLDWDALRMQYMLSIDGAPLFVRGGSSDIGFTAETAHPGLYFYGCTVRVHSVKIWDVASLPVPAARVLDQVGRAATTMYRPAKIDASRVINPWQRGTFPGIGGGVISGTVLVDGTPDIPVSRRVLLLDAVDGRVVAHTISEPGTGAYAFRGLHTGRQYTVVSQDTDNIYNAVVQDRISPVAA